MNQYDTDRRLSQLEIDLRALTAKVAALLSKPVEQKPAETEKRGPGRPKKEQQ